MALEPKVCIANSRLLSAKSIWRYMAVWQFDVLLVSRSLIADGSGCVHRELPCFSIDQCKILHLSDSLLDFSPQETRIQKAVEAIMPRIKSWSDDVLMYGNENGNKIELWPSAIVCRIDSIAFDKDLIRKVVSLAIDLDCLIVSERTGKIVADDLPRMN